jgi:hypothetical protein
VRSPAADSRVSWFRILLLAGELLFIGLAAFLAWLADLGPALAATTVAIAWLLAATLELMRWRSSKTHLSSASSVYRQRAASRSTHGRSSASE